MAQTCENCSAHSALAGQCRAEPPRGFVIGMTASGEPIVFGGWPPVEAGDWCLRWTERKEMNGHPDPR